MFNILEFIDEVKNEERIFIQTHNFPDHDAVASAYGLSELLLKYGINTDIIYKGEIQRDSLIKMIEELNINIDKYENVNIKAEDKIIVEVINFSVRNEKKGVNAAYIIQEVLNGIGFGGGHIDMAGGIIKDITKFNEENIYNLFVDKYEKSIT
jgi:nanoRNase/pAp phosphatase (c-di-AMP/oligoRNAs hydrolase)